MERRIVFSARLDKKPNSEPNHIVYSYFIAFMGIVILILFSAGSYRDIFRKMSSQKIVEDPRCEIYNNIRCENGGLLEETENGFVCKCTDDYYGEHCTQAISWSWLTWLFDVVNRNQMQKKNLEMWWSILPSTSEFQLKMIYYFQNNMFKKLKLSDQYTEGLKGNMTSTRILPPARPYYCLINKRLPPLAVLYNQIFQSESDQLKLDPKRRNVLFHTFFQYFVLQFFNTDFNSTITASQLYGADETTRRELRSFANGKLKTEYLNGEHYPPYLSSAKLVKMVYPPAGRSTSVDVQWFDRITLPPGGHKTKTTGWAMGHPLLSMNPMLFAVSTLWVREHNRVCDLLLREWPAWSDQQVYDTARKIVIGEMMGITINEILNVYADRPFLPRYRPEVFRDEFQRTNSFTTPFELLLTTVWPSKLSGYSKTAPSESVIFGDNQKVILDGMSKTIKFMVNNRMEMVTHNNDVPATEPLTKLMMTMSRENQVQSFNNYRRKLGLFPYKTFFELTRNSETAGKLKALYESVEDVELLTGMLTEANEGHLLTATAMANSFIINAIMTNPLHDKHSWNPNTFGGNIGFNLVKSANMKTFVSNNLIDKCDSFTGELYANN